MILVNKNTWNLAHRMQDTELTPNTLRYGTPLHNFLASSEFSPRDRLIVFEYLLYHVVSDTLILILCDTLNIKYHSRNAFGIFQEIDNRAYKKSQAAYLTHFKLPGAISEKQRISKIVKDVVWLETLHQTLLGLASVIEYEEVLESCTTTLFVSTQHNQEDLLAAIQQSRLEFAAGQCNVVTAAELVNEARSVN